MSDAELAAELAAAEDAYEAAMRLPAGGERLAAVQNVLGDKEMIQAQISFRADMASRTSTS